MLHAELTDALAARIQTEVGTFLGLRQTLLSLQGSRDPMVQSKASQLLRVQDVLEEQLKDALAKIDNIKSGAYTMSDLTSVGAFATSMEKQISDVRKLGGGSGAAFHLTTTSAILSIVASAAIIGSVMYARRGGRR